MNTLTSSARRRPWMILCLSAALLWGMLPGCDGGGVTLSIDRARIQERVSEKFPIERELELATLTLTDPVVDFNAGPDRIGLTTNLKLQRKNIPLAVVGKARTSGKVRYEKADATFYMADVRVEDLELPLQLLGKERKQRLLGLANTAVAGSIEEIPLDTLQSATSAEAANTLIQGVSVKQDKLIITLGVGQKKR